MDRGGESILFLPGGKNIPSRRRRYGWGVDQKRKLKQSLCTVLSGSGINRLSKSMWMGRLGDDMGNKDRLLGGSNY